MTERLINEWAANFPAEFRTHIALLLEKAYLSGKLAGIVEAAKAEVMQ